MREQAARVAELRPAAGPERLLNFAETCTRLGLAAKTVRRIMADPDECFPPRIRVGKRLYVRLGDLQRWLAEKAAAAA